MVTSTKGIGRGCSGKIKPTDGQDVAPITGEDVLLTEEERGSGPSQHVKSAIVRVDQKYWLMMRRKSTMMVISISDV